MNSYILVTSNEQKLKEFQSFGLNNLKIEKGRDLSEVESDAMTVIIYKSLEAGLNRIVEDTSLHVDGAEVGTNIRWLTDSISSYKGVKATWEVLLGVNNGETITIYQGLINGEITDKYKEPIGFGFDCYFVPEDSTETLYDLETKGEKDNYSARKNAIMSFLNDESIHQVNIKDIPQWNGKMQEE